MKYTEAEVRFLMGSHSVEHATGTRPIEHVPEIADTRLIGCPERVFERVLESRARRLGGRFAEFRARSAKAGAADEAELQRLYDVIAGQSEQIALLRRVAAAHAD